MIKWVREDVYQSGPKSSLPFGVMVDIDRARELIEDAEALEKARAGARRARETLTWDASARAHLQLYEEVT